MIKPLRATLDQLKVEVGEVVERWYNQGYQDGYNRAIEELAVKKGNPNELEMLTKEWGKLND